MKKKQLVLVIEGTASLAPFWSTIFFDYLNKIIRSISNVGSSSSSPNVEFALVIFNAHNSYTPCFVQRSTWTGNLQLFLEWLSAIHFTGGGFGDSAIAEGLSEALLMFPSPKILKNEASERHCILVAASNPYSLPTHIYRPTHTSDTHAETCLSDAETLAKSFRQCDISLSVICPMQLPKLKAIYNAGKMNPAAANPTTDIVKNPHYLVLISQNFMEACAALSPSKISDFPSNQIPIKTEATSVLPLSQPPPISLSPVNESSLNQQSIYVGNIHPAAVKAEPGTYSSALAGGKSTGSSSSGKNPRMTSSVGTVQVAPQYVGVNNNMEPNFGLPQQTSCAPPSRRSDYQKLWEGELYGIRRGQPVFITRIEAYWKVSASVPLIDDWPSMLHIERLISKDHMHNKYDLIYHVVHYPFISASWPILFLSMNIFYREYHTKSDFLVFRAMTQHGFLEQLQEKKICAVVRLPSQTLLLAESSKACRLIGMLLPGWHLLSRDTMVSKQQQQQQQTDGTGTNQGTGGQHN